MARSQRGPWSGSLDAPVARKASKKSSKKSSHEPGEAGEEEHEDADEDEQDQDDSQAKSLEVTVIGWRTNNMQRDTVERLQ